MNRRDLIQAITITSATVSSFLNHANAQTGTTATQAEYIFWLSERDRSIAQENAKYILTELDSFPLDRHRVSNLYHRGSSSLKVKSKEVNFVNRVLKYREGRGTIKERLFQSIEGGFTMLPGYANGKYVIVSFDSIFSNSRDIYTEQITLSLDSSNTQWQFADYYSAVKPFYTY
ncbi:DUF4019 domain-containing protein [Comamonas thiooxydans]|uniref:DUF4019 domain-containing protein n=1 Tax=Comamonas thiooxydans TaxID=363952 RepID=UPI001CCCD28A|nr:DUF4019 domain-containing protein [Comamonas thiooxydans]MCO8250045.1 DUF4019 domain-containing protein [Comamonas thiooxydans]UBQ44019.1 DUF4019 domain-containing protein [Comamonas thiooxydans]